MTGQRLERSGTFNRQTLGITIIPWLQAGLDQLGATNAQKIQTQQLLELVETIEHQGSGFEFLVNWLGKRLIAKHYS